MKKISIAIFFVGLTSLFYAGMTHAMNRQEIIDCHKWQRQAKEYRTFYLTKAEADQCQHHDIPVEAPIK